MCHSFHSLNIVTSLINLILNYCNNETLLITLNVTYLLYLVDVLTKLIEVDYQAFFKAINNITYCL